MDDIILLNYSVLNGMYNDIPLTVTSTTATTRIVTGLTAVKEADKVLWLDGQLTYTITITNNAGYDYEAPVFTDQLDTAKIQLDSSSVLVNDETTPFTYTNGILSIYLPTILTGQSVVVTFRVNKS